MRINSILPINVSQKVYTAQFGQTQFLPETNGTRFELYEINYSGNHEQIRLDILTGAQKSGILDQCIALTDQCMSDYGLDGWKDSPWVWDK